MDLVFLKGGPVPPVSSAVSPESGPDPQERSPEEQERSQVNPEIRNETKD